ncbi:MAG: hypothetical protein V4438_04125, partial [Patescibacteria group bacterium]
MQKTMLVDAVCNVHAHLREGEVMKPLIELAHQGGADIIGPMPNTTAGLTNPFSVHSYINACNIYAGELGRDLKFLPIMMMTEQTTESEITAAVESGIRDCKIYPYMRTTKSELGVKRYGNIIEKVKWAGKYGMKCHFHPEHPQMTFGNRDAEFAFLPLLYMFLQETEAIIISEHGTDARCIPHWKEMALYGRFYVTLTAHHLATNEDERFGDVRATCKPPIKTESDRLGLCDFVAEDHSWVMAGADDAPHNSKAKHVSQSKCACGAFTSPFLHQLYAHALDKMIIAPRGWEKYVNFTSRNARALHGLPNATRMVKLVREPFQIPALYEVGSWTVESYG